MPLNAIGVMYLRISMWGRISSVWSTLERMELITNAESIALHKNRDHLNKTKQHMRIKNQINYVLKLNKWLMF